MMIYKIELKKKKRILNEAPIYILFFVNILFTWRYHQYDIMYQLRIMKVRFGEFFTRLSGVFEKGSPMIICKSVFDEMLETIK